MAKKSASTKQKAAQNRIKRISALATKIQEKAGKKTVGVYKMNRNKAVAQAAKLLKQQSL